MCALLCDSCLETLRRERGRNGTGTGREGSRTYQQCRATAASSSETLMDEQGDQGIEMGTTRATQDFYCPGTDTRYTLQPHATMEHHDASTSDLSDAPISSAHSTPLRRPLDFSGLPYDLRRAITRTAAEEATVEDEVLFLFDRSASRSLLLVNKEFSEVVAPFHWDVSLLLHCYSSRMLPGLTRDCPPSTRIWF